jgi:hypothetical protein
MLGQTSVSKLLFCVLCTRSLSRLIDMNVTLGIRLTCYCPMLAGLCNLDKRDVLKRASAYLHEQINIESIAVLTGITVFKYFAQCKH